jgi:hypothetical protein
MVSFQDQAELFRSPRFPIETLFIESGDDPLSPLRAQYQLNHVLMKFFSLGSAPLI